MLLSILMPVSMTAMVCWGSSGGDRSPLLGAPEWSSMPYSKDTMPTSSVASYVLINWVGSSCFLRSKMAAFLGTENESYSTVQSMERTLTCSVETLESVNKAQFFCEFLWVPIFINENLK